CTVVLPPICLLRTDSDPTFETGCRDIYRNRRTNMNDRCCEEKLRLLCEYRNAATSYSARVALMAEIAGGSLPKPEFVRLSKGESQAHQKCMEARERFCKHTKEHGC